MMKTGNWEEITIPDYNSVRCHNSFVTQARKLGFDNPGSEGTYTGVAMRQWWLGNTRPNQLIKPFSAQLRYNPDRKSRVGGAILFLGLMGLGVKPECRICGDGYTQRQFTKTSLEVDHINEWAITKDNSPENLQILCSWCHNLQETGSSSAITKFREGLKSLGQPLTLTRQV